MASYGSDSDSDDASPEVSTAAAARAEAKGLRSRKRQKSPDITPLPPPPVDLLDLPSSIGMHGKRHSLFSLERLMPLLSFSLFWLQLSIRRKLHFLLLWVVVEFNVTCLFKVLLLDYLKTWGFWSLTGLEMRTEVEKTRIHANVVCMASFVQMTRNFFVNGPLPLCSKNSVLWPALPMKMNSSHWGDL